MDKRVSPTSGAAELDKFKRRLIRAVSRLLLVEKIPEEQLWANLKKETGCDCELLWTRMRSVVVKKLHRLLAANDCMDTLPKTARMTLTDWLLVDLVLVHQKIDVIGEDIQGKENEDHPVLVELVDLVKMFRIEYLRGEDLVEAWSSATLHYNKKGHHCSPMLLQRRWYQLKVIVRVKFYEFWFAYRGNKARIKHAQPFRPTPLETEIARTFKLVILQPFREWEELIEDRLVILPAEFEAKMKEKCGLKKPKRKPSEDLPDVMMIEPRIETIDLRLEPDVNPTEENSKEDDNPPPPLVRIKQEPLDPEETNPEETQIELPKKSIYEVVLESTHLENEQLDKLSLDLEGDYESYDNEIEEHEDTLGSTMGDEEESLLPQITNVFGNVSDTSVLANIDETRVYRTIESTNASGRSDDTNVTGHDKNIEENSTVDDTIVLDDNSDDNIDCDDLAENSPDNEKDTCACDYLDENSPQGVDKDTAFDKLGENSARDNDKGTGVFSAIDKKTDICANVEDASANIDNGSVIVGDASAKTEEVSTNVEEVTAYVGDVSPNVEEVSANVSNVSANVEDVSANVSNVSANVEDVSANIKEIRANVGDVSENIRETSPDIFDHDDINEISDDDENSGNVDETSVIGSAVKTCVTGNVEERSEIVVKENVPNTDILNAKAPNTDNKTVTDEAELSKDVDSTLHSIVITDSDDENQNFEDDNIFCNKSKPKGTIITERIIGHKNTTDQPMEIESTLPVNKISFTEPSKLTVINKDVMTEKVKGVIRPNLNSFTFGKLSHDISFADEGIELADDGIVYFDGDARKEKEVKKETREEEGTDEVPKIDEKLLMCPIIYTTRLDDMNLFRTRPFDHVNGKNLLDNITSKSKPTLNDEYNDSSKTIECLEENVSCKPNNNVSVDARSDLAMNVPIIDNSIKMRIEPLNKTVENVSKETLSIVHQEKESIENLMPENVDSVTSDDEDCDENVIDESQKVKPTSYLLQKPRSRTYNPIQLCKNPDFNTRLKRLNVGFFSSPRNRVLIKSCKPLTIDLSKAFESKLISGTLYLKPSDHNVVQEIIDDTRTQNVSVIPSAMPAQSLINNSKVGDILPMLRHETSKPPEDLGSMIERNKVINLPDITEIRRINQRLLTAEVTPIQVQNNLAQVPVTIVTSVNTPTYRPPKTLPISQTIADLPEEATDIRGPPKLLVITDDPPAKTSTEYNASNERNTVVVERPKSIIGRPPKSTIGKRLFPTRPVVWKPRELRPDIPWLSRSNDPVNNSKKREETLLTLDALNKMIFLLTDEHEPDSLPKKPKYKTKKLKNCAQQAKQQRGKIAKAPKPVRIDDISCKDTEPSKENDEISGEQTIKCPKINIRPAENYPPSLLYYPPNRSKPDDVDTDDSKKTIQYCCWARQRMLQLLFCRARIPPHDCPKICECCCKNLLRDYTLHDQKIKKAELQIIKNTAEYSASLEKANMINAGTFSYKKPVETVIKNPVETVVQNPVEIVIHNPDEIVIRDPVENVDHKTDGTLVETSGLKPVIDTVQLPGEKSILVPDEKAVANVEATNSESITCITDNEPIDLEAMDIDGNVPVLGGEVSIKTTAVVAPLVGGGLETTVNAIPGHSNVFPVSVPVIQKPKFISCQCVNREKVTQTYTYTHSVSADKLSGGLVLNPVTKPATITQPSLRQVLELKKAKNVLKRQKTKMPPPPKLIDPHLAANNMKQRMVYINSKKFTDKPTSLPVFLGKNKILLTTAKFPPNLKLFRKAKEALRASLKIPNGVHIICLPDGTISYHIDHNTTVKATQLAEMPALLAAVRAHMAAHAEQEEPVIRQSVFPTSIVMGSEVVNLIDDDDDDCGPNVSESDNNKTAIVTEDLTTEKNVTVHSVDSINDINNSQMKSSNETKGNHVEANVNGNLIAAVTENTQDENAHKNTNTIIDIQEDIQEPNQHIMPSVLTEQVQGHPELTPPCENVSADVNDIPKPSSHTESTDTQEVLAEQLQGRPDLTPPDQKVCAILHVLPKPLSHTESTDTQELLAEKVQERSDLTPPEQKVSADVNGLPIPSSHTESTDTQELLAEKVQDRSDLTPPSENVSADVNSLPKLSSHTESTDTRELLAEKVQDRSDLTPPSENVSADVNSLPKPSSHTESTDTQKVLAEQLQDQSDPSSNNVSTEVQNQPEQTAQNVSTAVPEDSSSEPRNKTKNILSDLMEMSGIFDEDITPSIEGTVNAQPAQVVTLAQPILMTPALDGAVPAQSAQSVSLPQPFLLRALSVPHVVPPALAPLTTIPIRPKIYPSVFNKNCIPKIVKSTIGDLTPITSLYELKYACATNGVFFKLDFETGLIAPINVCMKNTITHEREPAPQNVPIAPKSVIDLTDDDGKSEQKDTETNTSPGKRSLLLVNNVTSANALKTFSGPVKPVKLFKALKPSILQRLDMHKANRERKGIYKKSAVDHTIKRKQFLRKINLNSGADPDFMRMNVPKRVYERKLMVNRDLISLYKLERRPISKTTCKEPRKQLEITILSDDDSDDEPLAKKAKRKRENVDAPEQEANAPGNAKASEENATSPELLTNDIVVVVEKDLKEPETPTAMEIESELAEAADNDKMIEDDSDIIELVAASDFELDDSNDDSEDCILGF